MKKINVFGTNSTYLEKAKELRQNCYHAATCGMCSNVAKTACFDLCGWDSKTLAELDVNIISDYLKRCHPDEV